MPPLGWAVVMVGGAMLLWLAGYLTCALLTRDEPAVPEAPTPVAEHLGPGEFQARLAQDVLARVN